ncbi:MAG: S8 family peptidase [Polyangiaceae bacterium]|nr:S8 family peptidase [Polyangiaceae bacterium]
MGTDPDTGVVLLDAPGPNLERLREKSAEYGELKTRKKGDGTTTSPPHVAALGPVEQISVAADSDLAGVRLREWSKGHGGGDDRKLWFELACRGGYRNPPAWSSTSRGQINRQLAKFGHSVAQDFEAPEELSFFVRLTTEELRALVASVDCIFTYDLVPPETLTWLVLKDVPRREIREFVLQPPPKDAPAVVVLDTGISTEHPLLKNAILHASSIIPGVPSVEDTHGHGTKMAGAALYADLGSELLAGRSQANHWLQSVRILVAEGVGTGAPENRPYWPKMTVDAVSTAETTEAGDRRRAYALAVTFPISPLTPTSWAQAVDQLAFNEGRGRLFCVSAGNVQAEKMFATATAYPDSLFQWKIHEPAQGNNALTVGAYTDKTSLPPDLDYKEARPVAPLGGAAPHTTTGVLEPPWPIKPDVVMEGGNIALTETIADTSADTMVSLTTGHRHLTNPLASISMTSEAAARAARMAVDIWKEDPSLRPETVRGLLVHSASWTGAMRSQFKEPDLFHVCGYGVPDLELARACAADRATVVVEDAMPNFVIKKQPKKKPPRKPSTSPVEDVRKRIMKVFRMPAPEELLLADPEVAVELRVTLSYFAEPSTFRTRVEHGLDLKWDMQGPQESEEEFLERLNDLLRPTDDRGKKVKKKYKKSFPWEIGIQRRSRGTVQSDRWSGKASLLAGAKLIGVVPVVGWWDRRAEMVGKELPFSLIISIAAAGIYNAVKVALAAPVTIEV